MNRKGFDKLSKALKDNNIRAEVVPKPRDDEDVRFVSIVHKLNKTLVLSNVLNALDAENIGETATNNTRLWSEDPDEYRDTPALEFFSQTETIVTLKDLKVTPQG